MSLQQQSTEEYRVHFTASNGSPPRDVLEGLKYCCLWRSNRNTWTSRVVNYNQIWVWVFSVVCWSKEPIYMVLSLMPCWGGSLKAAFLMTVLLEWCRYAAEFVRLFAQASFHYIEIDRLKQTSSSSSQFMTVYRDQTVWPVTFRSVGFLGVWYQPRG